MKLAFAALCAITLAAMATGEFSTGGAEMWKFKGWGIFRLDMYGMEDVEPDMAFSTCADIVWEPRLNEMLSAKAELQMISDGNADFKDAYLCLMPAEGVSITGGQFKRNFGWGYLEPTTALLFPDRPMYTNLGLYGNYGKRDMGLMLAGDFDMFGLDLAYTNGVVENAETDSNKQFTIHGTVQPAEWATIGLGMGMYSAYVDSTMDETYSSTGIDVYGVMHYPASETVDIHFTGEYMMLGYAGPDVEGMEKTDGTVMTAALGATFGLQGNMITGITPMIRYEQISPATMAVEGADDLEDNYGAIDFCANLHMGPANVLQIGARNYSYESDAIDGYTDIVVNWRMNF
jgi:hypothetical protein